MPLLIIEMGVEAGATSAANMVDIVRDPRAIRTLVYSDSHPKCPVVKDFYLIR